MAEYINKRDALKIMRDAWDICENGDFAISEAINCVESLPAADVVERKKGKWLEHDTDKTFAKCSECGCYWELAIVKECNMDFCPHCGAEMSPTLMSGR